MRQFPQLRNNQKRKLVNITHSFKFCKAREPLPFPSPHHPLFHLEWKLQAHIKQMSQNSSNAYHSAQPRHRRSQMPTTSCSLAIVMYTAHGLCNIPRLLAVCLVYVAQTKRKQTAKCMLNIL